MHKQNRDDVKICEEHFGKSHLYTTNAAPTPIIIIATPAPQADSCGAPPIIMPVALAVAMLIPPIPPMLMPDIADGDFVVAVAIDMPDMLICSPAVAI